MCSVTFFALPILAGQLTGPGFAAAAVASLLAASGSSAVTVSVAALVKKQILPAAAPVGKVAVDGNLAPSFPEQLFPVSSAPTLPA